MNLNYILAASLFLSIGCASQLTVPSQKNAEALIFQAKPAIEKWKVISPRKTTMVKQAGEVLEIYKTGKDINWNGIQSPAINIAIYRGMPVVASFDAKLKDIKSYGSKSFHCFVAAIEFFNNKETKAISRKSLLFKAPANNWENSALKADVPQNADTMKLKFTFGKSTGMAQIKDIKVIHPVFSVKSEYSKIFKNSLIVQKTNSSEAKNSILTISKKGKIQATNQVTFDEKGMDFNISVHDDKFFQIYEKFHIWKGDSIQMAFDPEYDRTEAPNDDDYELGFALVKNKPFIYPYRTYQEKTFSGYRISSDFLKRPNSYIYKINIPWGVIQPLNYNNVKAIGYAFAVNDNDGKGRKAYEWSSGVTSEKAPHKYGVLIFDKEERKIGAELFTEKTQLDFFDGEAVNFSIMAPCLSDKYRKLLCSVTLEGKRKIEYQNSFNLSKGENRFNFSFNSNEMNLGENTLIVSVFAYPGGIKLLDRTIRLKRASLDKVLSQIESFKKNINKNMAQLESILEQYKNKNKKPREILASLGVAKVFLPCIKTDLKNKRYGFAFQEAKETNAIIKQALQRINDGEFVLSAAKTVVPIQIKDGSFFNSKNEAVFLYGAYGSQPITILKDLSFNTKRLGWPALNVMFKDKSLKLELGGKNWIDYVISSATEARKNNLICSADPISPVEKRIPKYFKKLHPEAFVSGNHFLALDPDHPEFIRVWNKYAEVLFDELRKAGVRKDFFCIDMHREPGFSSITDYTMKKFRPFLKKRYASIDMLNKYWKSDFKSFEEIKEPKKYFADSKVAYYDWCVFNNKRFTNHFRRMDTFINPPNEKEKFPVCATFMNGIHWRDKNHYNTGYDRERLMEVTTVNGCDTRIYPEADKDFALYWQNQSMCFDFQKSLAPKQPIFDAEWHSVQTIGHNHQNIPQKYMRCVLRLATWHGMNACHIWCFIYKRNQGNTGKYLKGNLHTQPLQLEAYSQESIKIEQEMERILPFYNEERPIGIYYSLSSAIFDSVEYLNVLKNIYKAFYFHDVNLSFVTEKMLKTGDIKTKGLKLLIFPNARYCDLETLDALQKLEKQGVNILFIGEENLSRNTLDEKNRKGILENKSVWPIASDWKKYMEKSSRIIEEAGIKREYKIQMKSKDKLKTVEARFAEHKGKSIGYAINLGNTARTFSIISLVDNQRRLVKNISTNETHKDIKLNPMEYISFDIIESNSQP